MPRHPRCDAPGTWHHVMNRGLARRTLFESNLDIRTFLSRLARVVRAGRIEVHAFCVMSTHFHLLVRSPDGELSEALQSVQNEYVRWFNRGRRRDGPLMRGRFISKVVASRAYRCQVVRYIDANPLLARLAAAPALYPHGSARWFARSSGPPWLTRTWIEAEVRECTGHGTYRPQDYAAAFGAQVSPGLARLVEERLEFPANGPDPLDELLSAAAPGVLAWMRRKASLADGTKVGYPVCDRDELDAALLAEAAGREMWRVETSRKRADAWRLARVGLLRDLCAATLADCAERLGMSQNAAWHAHKRHRELLDGDEEYARIVAEIAVAALRRCHGPAPDRAARELSAASK